MVYNFEVPPPPDSYELAWFSGVQPCQKEKRKRNIRIPALWKEAALESELYVFFQEPNALLKEGASPSTKPPDSPSKLKMYNVFFSEHLHGLSEEGNKLFETKCPRHFFCFSWLPCFEHAGLIFLNVKPRLQKGCCYCSLSRVRL